MKKSSNTSLETLKPVFISEMTEVISRMTRAIDSGDYLVCEHELKRGLHYLASASKELGLTELSNIASSAFDLLDYFSTEARVVATILRLQSYFRQIRKSLRAGDWSDFTDPHLCAEIEELKVDLMIKSPSLGLAEKKETRYLSFQADGQWFLLGMCFIRRLTRVEHEFSLPTTSAFSYIIDQGKMLSLFRIASLTSTSYSKVNEAVIIDLGEGELAIGVERVGGWMHLSLNLGKRPSGAFYQRRFKRAGRDYLVLDAFYLANRLASFLELTT